MRIENVTDATEPAIDLKSMLPEELEALLKELGQPAYRAGQLFSWLSKGVSGFEEMKNLPLALREALAQRTRLDSLRCLRKQTSSDGTVKLLWELRDGNSVETVVMRYDHGLTVCISSQVGCRMGCGFCASTLGGLVRNLSAGEMLEEVLRSQAEAGERVSHVVLMGIGEPLDNYDNVLRFLKLATHPKGLNLSMRHISLSTCGLTEGIRRLAEEKLQLTLAISLHAPDDATRSALMPVNRGAKLSQLEQACKAYFRTTGRRITLEYAMIHQVNDSPAQAEQLAGLARRLGAHINLIPLNPVAERNLRPSSGARIRAFCQVLEQRGANYTIRRSLGGDVDAACGQLRRRQEKERKGAETGQ